MENKKHSSSSSSLPDPPKTRSEREGGGRSGNKSSSGSARSSSGSHQKTASKLRDGDQEACLEVARTREARQKVDGKSKGKQDPNKPISETMKHPKHPHRPIVLMKQGKPFTCSGCKEPGFGPRYKCQGDSCDFILHKECAKARSTDIYKKHPLTADREFEFLWEPPGGPDRRYCVACGRNIRGFCYHDHRSKKKL